MPAGGSSPLARGLRPAGQRVILAVGIIPARAGFTPHRPRRGPDCEDHPRSRGVYDWRDHVQPVCDGSSPLARGLPSPSGETATIRGIIPARAGFTRAVRARAAWMTGSSPLARGLRHAHRRHHVPLGIIPARAGFTHAGRRRRPAPPDHPRSRGVYYITPISPAGGEGSSPLARGLPHRVGGRPVRRGIIPARAGFTEGE